jgi:hypothetical protein
MTRRTLNLAGRSLAASLAVAMSFPQIAAGKPKEAAGIQASEAVPSYAVAEDRNIRISVDEVLMAGMPGYLPKDKNWLQLHVTVTNKSSAMAGFTDLRQRMTNGTVIEPARVYTELNKPPTYTGMVGKQVAIGGAAQMAAMFIAPPLMLVGSVATLFGGTLGLDKRQKKNARLQKSMLSATPIAPGTSVTGSVYVPALQDHNGLVVFYSDNGGTKSLTLQRIGAPAPIVLPPPAAEAPVAARPPVAPPRKRAARK